jgi:hypothetical protein
MIDKHTLETEIRKYNSLLAVPTNTGENAGHLEHKLGIALRKLGDLNATGNPAAAKENYRESSNAYFRAREDRAYATGETAGGLEHSLGLLLSNLGDLNVKDNPAEAKQYNKDSCDAYFRALKNRAYATVTNAGRLEEHLGYSLHSLGNLNATDNPGEAKQYYKEGSEAFDRALKNPLATGRTAGQLEDNRGRTLTQLADLYVTDNPAEAKQCYQESSEATQRALKNSEYATGETVGRLEDNLGLTLLRLGNLILTDNPADAQQYFKESSEATQRALKNHAYAMGANAGRLEGNLGGALLRLGNLNVTDNPADAQQYYKESSEATQRALKDPVLATGRTAGMLEHNLQDSLLSLGDLTNDPTHYKESSEATQRALKNPEYATGRTAGQLEDNLGLTLLRLGNLILTDNPADAQQYFKESSEATQRALKNRAYATGTNAKKGLEANLKESNEALRRVQKAVTKGKKALPKRESAGRQLQDVIGRLLGEASTDNLSQQLMRHPRELAQASADADLLEERRTRRLQKQDPAFTEANRQLTLKHDFDDAKGEEWQKALVVARDRKGVKSVELPSGTGNMLFKVPDMYLQQLGHLTTLTINDSDLQGLDLSRCLTFLKTLEHLNLPNCKVDRLDVDTLPTTLKKIDLSGRDTVLPLPLQRRLENKLGEANVTITPWPNRVKEYDRMLQGWSINNNDLYEDHVHEEHKETRETIAAFLNDTSETSLSLKNHKLDELPPYFHAMIAGGYPTSIDLSGNALGLHHANGQAKPFDFSGFALMENLKTLDVSFNALTDVSGLEGLAKCPQFDTLNLEDNDFVRLPNRIEAVPGNVKLKQDTRTKNKLSNFAKVDAKLANLKKRDGQIETDNIVSNRLSIHSHQFNPNVLGAIDYESTSIRRVEQALKDLSAASHLKPNEIEAHKERWQEIEELFTTQAHAHALEKIISNHERMGRYYQMAENGAETACTRAAALHPLLGQPDVQSGTAGKYKIPNIFSKGASIAASATPVPIAKETLQIAGKVSELGIAWASSKEFNAFHHQLSQVFRPHEMETATRVIPLAMTLMMGDRLESETPVNAGTLRPSDSSDKFTNLFKKIAHIGDDSSIEAQRAFKDVSYLFDDIASFKPFDAASPGERAKKLRDMPLEDKLRAAMKYFANHNSAGETLPYKDHFILCDLPEIVKMETIARNFALESIQKSEQVAELQAHTTYQRRELREIKRGLGIPRNGPELWPNSDYAPGSNRSTPTSSDAERRRDKGKGRGTR